MFIIESFTNRFSSFWHYVTRRGAVTLIMALAFITPLVSFAAAATRQPDLPIEEILIEQWWLLLAPIAIVIWLAFNRIDPPTEGK